jgi:diguanylate cyclase
MKLPFNKKPEAVTPEQLMAELEECRERGEVLRSATLALIACVKEFSFGLKEINAEGFAQEMEAVKQQVSQGNTPAVLRRALTGTPEAIDAFIQREKAYLDEREAEYKTIIDMLRHSLSSLFDDNQAFTNSISDHNVQMEQIIYLEDIRRIKERLRNQVEAMRTTVATKKAADLRRMEKLSREVDILRTNLERVTDISNTDALTGAHNRLAFDLTLQHMIDRFALAKTRFALLLCDLDNFKAINDTHGHPVGDRVLKSFVTECQGYFRDEDFIARYGGEEFAIILPSASLRAARKRAHLFCRKLAALRFRIYADKPEETLGFTTSIGVSEIHRDDTPETVIARADRALYLAKHSGKNRVMCEQDVAREARRKPAR